MALKDKLAHLAVSDEALKGVKRVINVQGSDVEVVLKCCPNPEYNQVLGENAVKEMDRETSIVQALSQAVIVSIEGETDQAEIFELLQTPNQFKLKEAIKMEAYEIGIAKAREVAAAKKP